MNAGFIGMAIGRNVWQVKDPMNITKKLKKVIMLDYQLMVTNDLF